jgi:predicted PurR-regulated permease PerM
MNKENQPILISITPGAILRGIAIIALFYFLFVVRELVLVLLTSVVLASAVEPFAAWFVSKKIPRVISVLIIYISTLLLMAVIFYFFVPTLIGEVRNIISNLPDYVSTFSDKAGLLNSIPEVNGFLSSLSAGLENQNLLDQFGGMIYGATYSFFNVASGIFGGIVSFVLIITLSFYLSVQEDGVANFLKVVLPVQYENYILDLWKRARKKIGLWMQGQLLLGLLVGVLVYLGLTILGIQNALLLSIITAVFELIPVFGPILSSVPAISFGLTQGGATLGFLVMGLYIIVQQFESQLIHPLVVKKIVGIPAIIAILALMVGAKIAGFLGIILAVPVTAALMEYFSDLEKKKVREMKSDS